MQRALRGGHGLAGEIRHSLSGPGDVGARVGRPAELLHAALEQLGVLLRLLEVLLEPLLVRGARRKGDVRLERGLQLLLLAVRLVQVLNQLRISGIDLFGHRERPPYSRFGVPFWNPIVRTRFAPFYAIGTRALQLGAHELAAVRPASRHAGGPAARRYLERRVDATALAERVRESGREAVAAAVGVDDRARKRRRLPLAAAALAAGPVASARAGRYGDVARRRLDRL